MLCPYLQLVIYNYSPASSSNPSIIACISASLAIFKDTSLRIIASSVPPNFKNSLSSLVNTIANDCTTAAIIALTSTVLE